MADGTTLDPGAGGDVIATDDLGATGKVQWVKLRDGTDGGTQTVASGNGTNAAALRVTVASDSTGVVGVTDNGGSLTVDGSVTADTELTTADLDTGAGTDTRAVVGLVLAKSGGAANISTTDPLPVSDAGGNLSIDDGGNSITVDASAASFAVNSAQVAGTATDTNSGVKSAGTQRVVLATDQPQLTNALKVDGSAVTQPVSGTVTANAGTGPFPISDNAGSITVDAAAATFANNQAQVAGTTVSVNSGVKDAGTQRVILASDQTVVPVSDNAGSLTVDAPVGTPAFVRLSDGAAAITALPVTDNAGSLTVDATAATFGINNSQVSGTAISVNTGTRDAGTQRVILASDQTVVPISDNSGSLTVDGSISATPTTTGGLTTFHLSSAGSTNATNIKASAGQVYGWYVYNSNAAARKVAFHNTAGTPTAGASVLFSIVLPPGSAANVEYTNGIVFSTGIAITTVTGLTDADTTAVAAQDLDINIFYK